MNQELLRYFQELTPMEQDILKGKFVDKSNYVYQHYMPHDRQLRVTQHARFRHYAEHIHDCVEIVYVCSGELVQLINGVRILQRAGELLILSQYAKQEILPAGENDIAVNFIVLPSFFEKTLSAVEHENSSLRHFQIVCLQNDNMSGGYLHYKVADVPLIQNLVENLLLSLITPLKNKSTINEITMELLLLHLLNYDGEVVSGPAQNALAIRILDYIGKNYVDCTLTGLAKELGYDTCWLSKNIKRLTGSTFSNLLQDKRLSRVRFLLKTTNLRVNEIARQAGYSNSGYFYRVFEENNDCSPLEWRKKYPLDESMML